jgi:hypothetical protein
MKTIEVRHTFVKLVTGISYAPANISFDFLYKKRYCKTIITMKTRLKKYNFDKIYSISSFYCVLLADYYKFLCREVGFYIQKLIFNGEKMKSWREIKKIKAKLRGFYQLNHPDKKRELYNILQKKINSFMKNIKIKIDSTVFILTYIRDIRLTNSHLRANSIGYYIEYPVELSCFFCFAL